MQKEALSPRRNKALRTKKDAQSARRIPEAHREVLRRDEGGAKLRGFEKGHAGLAGSLVLCLSLMISDCTFARDPDQIRFRTPTNRIHCLFSMENGNPGSTALLCDIDQSVVKKPARSKPADCKSDWGRRFQFGNDGGAGLECAPDWVGSNDSQVLAYGTSITGEILCSSDATGLTCKNAKGHGFFPVTTRSTNF